VALATHAVLMNVNVLIWTLFMGFSVAASIRIGNCLGANMPKRARMACYVALASTLALALVFTVLLYSLSGSIPRLFLDDSDSVALASKIMALWSPLEVVDGLNAVLQGIFRGAGQQKPAAITNVVAFYIGGIPFGALLAFQFDLGVEGLWLGIGFGLIVTVSVLLFLVLRCWKWDKLADTAHKRTAQ
ncbi:hypothetical protein BBJ28_00022187, partial [Nothophytophthora sp. Chile5]